MLAFEHIRKCVFWSLDFLKGSPIKRHYKEVKFIMENPNTHQASTIKANRLKEILKYASENTAFYSIYKDCSFNEFPIISKDLVVNNFNEFESKQYLNKKRYLASTSGSTGFPFKLWLNRNKKQRNTADTLYFSELANYTIGRKLFYLKLWEKKNYKGSFTLFIENIFKHDVMHYTIRDLRNLLAKMGASKSSKVILGYSSFLEYLSNFMKDENINIKNANIESIITMAEALDEKAKERLMYQFNTTVYSRYSNQENGILAQQTKFNPDHYISNVSSYKIEFLDIEKDEPAKIGSWGRIVITDLFNYAMPLIRYDTGDLAIAATFDEKRGYEFKEILGRKFDVIYNTDGELVIPHTFLHIENYSKCVQFQFIQDDKKEYRFKINGKQEDTDEKAASAYFRELLGQDANIRYEYVDEIPKLSSGKHQKVTSNYRKIEVNL